MKSSPFWGVTQLRLVARTWRFGRTYVPHLQTSSSQRLFDHWSWIRYVVPKHQ